MIEGKQDPAGSDVQRMPPSLEDTGALQTRLDEVVRRKGLRDVRVVVRSNGRVRTWGEDVGAVAAGCLTKPLTAQLIDDAVAEGRLRWDSAVTDLLGPVADAGYLLSGITVAHLLEHTHGLDASNVPGVPRNDDGSIDAAALCRQLGRRPLHEPGRMYSYGHAGAWLGAAILERLHGVPFLALLQRRRWVDDDESVIDPASICPATGGTLRLRFDQWLDVARSTIERWPAAARESSGQVALPGWHPSERAIYRGWKCYGNGWMGHNANLAGSSAVLRIHPENDVTLVVSASDANGATFAASGMFADVLPEFYAMRPPRLLKAAEEDGALLPAHVGRYAQDGRWVDVTLDDQGILQLSVEHAGSPTVSASRRLRPAAQGVFLAGSGGSPEFMFVQFIADGASAMSGFLWNGRQVWRRVEGVLPPV